MKKVYFNKGTARGVLLKSEIVEYTSNGKSGEFLAMEIEAGSGNKVKATIFPTKANPRKHTEIHSQYPVGTLIEVSGNVQEKEFTTQSGKKATDRSISGFMVKPMDNNAISVATFILHGMVEAVRETPKGIKLILKVDNSYEKDGKVVERDPSFFTLEGDVADLIDVHDVVKGCNAKFKGRILNQLELDDYGDIVGSIQMFLIEKIENVVDPSDLDDGLEEDLPF